MDITITPHILAFLFYRCTKRLQCVTAKHSTFKLSPQHFLSSQQQFFRFYFPIGMFMAADIALTNVAFQFISVALAEVTKSGVIVIVLFHSHCTQRIKSSKKWDALIVLLMLTGIVLARAGQFAESSVPSEDASTSATTAAENSSRLTWGFIAACAAMIFSASKLLFLENLTHESSPGNQKHSKSESTLEMVAELTLKSTSVPPKQLCLSASSPSPAALENTALSLAVASSLLEPAAMPTNLEQSSNATSSVQIRNASRSSENSPRNRAPSKSHAADLEEQENFNEETQESGSGDESRPLEKNENHIKDCGLSLLFEWTE